MFVDALAGGGPQGVLEQRVDGDGPVEATGQFHLGDRRAVDAEPDRLRRLGGLRRPGQDRVVRGRARAAMRVKMHSAPAIRATSRSPPAMAWAVRLTTVCGLLPPMDVRASSAGASPRRSATSRPGLT